MRSLPPPKVQKYQKEIKMKNKELKKSEFDYNLSRFEKISKLLKYSMTLLRKQYDNSKPEPLTQKIIKNTFNDFVNFDKKSRIITITERNDIEEYYPVFILRNNIYFLITDEFHYFSLKPKKCIVLKIGGFLM